MADNNLKKELLDNELDQITGGTLVDKKGNTIYTKEECQLNMKVRIYDSQTYVTTGIITRKIGSTILIKGYNGTDYEYSGNITCGPLIETGGLRA